MSEVSDKKSTKIEMFELAVDSVRHGNNQPPFSPIGFAAVAVAATVVAVGLGLLELLEQETEHRRSSK